MRRLNDAVYAVQFAPGLEIPKNDAAVALPAACQGATAIRRDDHGCNLARVSLQTTNLPAAGHVPNANRAILAPGQDPLTILGQRHCMHPSPMAFEPPQLLSGLHLPQAHAA